MEEKVERYDPNRYDVAWLKTLVAKLKVGGHWILPSFAVEFVKTNETTIKAISSKEMKIMATIAPLSAFADEVIERTKIVGEETGILVLDERDKR